MPAPGTGGHGAPGASLPDANVVMLHGYHFPPAGRVTSMASYRFAL